MRHDIDLPTPSASHVGSVAARLDLKFLDGVWRRTQVLRIECRIGVRGAVQQEKVRIGTRATYHHSGPLPWPPIQRIRGSRLCPKPYVRSGHREHEVNQHAPIQWQLANGRGLDDFTDAGVGRL